MRTWKPWNPVAMKKVEPKIPSEIRKSAETYSKAWKPVKIIAKKTVNKRPDKASAFKPEVIAWWAYVTEAPLLNKIKVLTKGTSKALKVLIPLGGQILPISVGGVKLEAKKAQKNAKKNITSETINNIIP